MLQIQEYLRTMVENWALGLALAAMFFALSVRLGKKWAWRTSIGVLFVFIATGCLETFGIIGNPGNRIERQNVLADEMDFITKILEEDGLDESQIHKAVLIEILREKQTYFAAKRWSISSTSSGILIHCNTIPHAPVIKGIHFQVSCEDRDIGIGIIVRVNQDEFEIYIPLNHDILSDIQGLSASHFRLFPIQAPFIDECRHRQLIMLLAKWMKERMLTDHEQGNKP